MVCLGKELGCVHCRASRAAEHSLTPEISFQASQSLYHASPKHLDKVPCLSTQLHNAFPTTMFFPYPTTVCTCIAAATATISMALEPRTTCPATVARAHVVELQLQAYMLLSPLIVRNKFRKDPTGGKRPFFCMRSPICRRGESTRLLIWGKFKVRLEDQLAVPSAQGRCSCTRRRTALKRCQPALFGKEAQVGKGLL